MITATTTTTTPSDKPMYQGVVSAAIRRLISIPLRIAQHPIPGLGRPDQILAEVLGELA